MIYDGFLRPNREVLTMSTPRGKVRVEVQPTGYTSFHVTEYRPVPQRPRALYRGFWPGDNRVDQIKRELGIA